MEKQKTKNRTRRVRSHLQKRSVTQANEGLEEQVELTPIAQRKRTVANGNRLLGQLQKRFPEAFKPSRSTFLPNPAYSHTSSQCQKADSFSRHFGAVIVELVIGECS